MSVKAPAEAARGDAAALRVLIVHARWNRSVVDALVSGARKQLLGRGVREENLVVSSVPGSWELPLAVKGMVAASQVQAGAAGGDLLGGAASASSASASLDRSPHGDGQRHGHGTFDAVIAIGCLIKGRTMHFEYIAEAVSHGLMKASLDLNIPVIFGVLTVLKDRQAEERAGLVPGCHNHAEDWADAAIEMGRKRGAWQQGTMDP